MNGIHQGQIDRITLAMALNFNGYNLLNLNFLSYPNKTVPSLSNSFIVNLDC